jgi:hypothetical protein
MSRASFRASAAAGVWALCALAPGATVGEAPPITVTFGEILSDFTGPVPVGEARVTLDAATREVLVGEARTVHVFNDAGMEVFRFQISSNLGAIRDLAVLPEGEILALAYDQAASADRPRFVIARHDYRGAPRGEIAVSGLPPQFQGILPNRMVLRGERLVLASTTQLLAIATRPDGSFLEGYDLGKLLGIPEEDRANTEITGFNADGEGNLLLTCAVLFRAFSIARDGSVASWGEPGAIAGTFGNTGGISRDAEGRYFVADKLRRVVLVFDRSFRFLLEFGGDPSQPGHLGRPSDVVADGAGRLYVTQVGRSGVFAYDVRSR